jgi:Alpha/beta hydrolase family
MARFLLVHGAWHGGWCWAEVADGLRARGHDVEAPDLPCDEVGLTVHDYAARLPAGAEILVGHSLGAQTVALLDAPVRVYLGGLLPVENVYRDAFSPTFGGAVRDELGRSYWPDAETCHAGMYPDCTRAQSDRAFAQLRRQAPVDTVVAPFRPEDVIVATLRDGAIDPQWQLRVARENGVRTIELDSGHSPFITQPDELAALLHDLA